MESAVCPVTIGRTAELDRLRHTLLAAATQHQSKLVLLTGDAGIGKTRLANEAAAYASELGMTVLWGSCAVADLSLPYLPYVEAIGNQLTPQISQQLQWTRELAALFPQLDADAPPQDPADTGQSRLRLYEALLSLLRHLAGDAAILLVIDDLQWADAATLELLDYQLRRLQTQKAVILATCRTEELPRQHPLTRMLERWRRTPQTATIDLQKLGPDDVAAMVKEILTTDRVNQETVRLLHDRCDGNPYAVEEMLKSSIDHRGRLPDTLRLPRSVRDTLLQRLERLPQPTIDLIRAASVLRSPFAYPTLAAITNDDAQHALRQAIEEQFLEEDPNASDEYRFRHPLTRDAVYEDMIAPQREALHLRAAEALAASQDTPAIDLAHHMLAAHRHEAAVPLALEAADQANRTHAYADAARLYERVVNLIADKPTKARVTCELGTALLLAGDTAKALDHLAKGVEELDDQKQTTAAEHYRLMLGRCLWERGEVGRAFDTYVQVRDALAPQGPSEDLALAYVRLAGLAIFELDGPETTRLATEAERLAEEAQADTPRIWAYGYHGLGLVQEGRVDDGLHYLDRSYYEAREKGLNVIAANALYNSIIVLNQHFRPRAALERLRALHAIQAGSMASLQALRAEGMIRLWGTGEPELARAAFEDALALARAGDATHFVNWIETQLANVHLQLDDPRRAAELLPREGAQVEGQDRVIEAWARLRLDLVTGRLDAAAARARAVVGEQGWPLRVRLFLGDIAIEALVAAEQLDDARAALEWCTGAPDHPYRQRMEGRIALAEGDPEKAIGHLRRCLDQWEPAGVAHEAAWTRLALAEALDAVAAEKELRAGLESARGRGARLEERVFTERLSVPPDLSVDAIQASLESLLDSRSPAPKELVERLTAAIERAAGLADPRDAEAGRVLRDYYLKRVGSHEVVAERLHLSRTTFYRRLRRGWELVAADFGRSG